MKQYLLTPQRIEHYQQYLYEEERSDATIEKYLRYINRFEQWLENRKVTKELVLEWKRLQISNHQRRFVGTERAISLSGVALLSSTVFTGAAAQFSGFIERID